MKEVYDCIIPIGGSCAIALQLKRRQLRRFSLGLDWAGNHLDPLYFRTLERGFRNGFADFCLAENMSPAEMAGHHGMKDSAYGVYFPHDFKIKEDEPVNVDAGCEAVRRRMARMLEVLRISRRVLMVTVTEVDIPRSEISRFLDLLHELFPTVDVDLRIMRFAAKEGPYGEESVSDHVRLCRYARILTDEQDFHGDGEEWRFMDGLTLSDRLKGFGRPSPWKGLFGFLRRFRRNQ